MNLGSKVTQVHSKIKLQDKFKMTERSTLYKNKCVWVN